VSNAQESRIRELERQLELAQEKIAKQDARIAELERRLLQFENPHTPPSLRVKAKKRPPKHGKPGQKPGHEGTTRPFPEPDRIESAELKTCPHCDAKLGKPESADLTVVEEIPEPRKPEVIGFLDLHYHCKKCGEDIVSIHPDKPKSGRLGANAQVAITLMRYNARLPHRRIADILLNEFGFPLAPATAWNTTRSVAGALKPEYEQLIMELRRSPCIYGDETCFRVNGVKWWLWVFTNGIETVFVLRRSRGIKVIREILGRKFRGVLVSDGHYSYASYSTLRQRCWAHLLRELKDLAEKDARAKGLYHEFSALYKRMTEAVGKGPPPEERLKLYEESKKTLDWLLAAKRRGTLQKFIRKMRVASGSLLTFILHPGVEPTNNIAERALRENIVMRKIIGTLRNESGAEVHAINMSMLTTWKQRGENPYRVLKPLLCSG